MIKLGDKVIVNGAIGIVKYLGSTKFADGTWCGVELINSSGKNDGSVQGIRYFELTKKDQNYGLFAKIDNVKLVSDSNDDGGLQLQQTINVLKEKLINTTVQFQRCKKELEAYKTNSISISELQNTIETLSLRDVEFEAHNIGLNEELKLITADNAKLRSKLITVTDELKIRSLADINDAFEDDASTMKYNNQLLKTVVKRLEGSLNGSLKENEDLLTENTDLLQTNIEITKKLNSIEQELLSTKGLITELTNNLEAQKNLDSIVDFLTEKNEDLSNQLNVLNKRITSLKEKSMEGALEEENENLKLQIDNMITNSDSDTKNLSKYKKLNKELEVKLYEIKDNENGVSTITDLRIQIATLEHERYTNHFLTGLNEIYLSFNNFEMDFMASYFKFISKWIFNDKIRNSITEKYELQIHLLILYILTDTLNALDFDSEILEHFITVTCDIPTWNNEILDGYLSNSQIKIANITDFINKNEFIRNNNFIWIQILHKLMHITIPGVLGYLKQQDMLDTNELYVHCISIEKKTAQLCQTWISTNHNQFDLVVTSGFSLFKNVMDLYDKLILTMKTKADKDDKLMITLNSINESVNSIAITKSDTQSQIKKTQIDNESEAAIPPIQDNSTTIPEIQPEISNEYIEELLTKNSILKERLKETSADKELLDKFKLQMKEHTSREKNLVKNRDNYKQEALELNRELEAIKLKKYQVLQDEELVDLVLEKDKIKQIDLISEIKLLRQIIRRQHQTVAPEVSSNLAWLTENSRKDPSQLRQISKEIYFQNIHILTKDIMKTVDFCKINSSNSKSDVNYLFKLKTKQKNICMQLSNIVK